MADIDSELADARAALDGGDAARALAGLRAVLDYPGRLDGALAWVSAMELLCAAGAALYGGELAEKAQAAVDGSDGAALYELGVALGERGLYATAATVLARANRLAPGSEALVAELASSLEHAGLHAAACDKLREASELLKGSFVLRYLLGWNGALARDLDETRRQLPTLADGADEDERAMAARLAGMLARADAVGWVSALDGRDARGWHFVINGGVVLALPGDGGRFDGGDGAARARDTLERLRVVVGAWSVTVPRVFLLPDPASAALGEAAATLLGAPTAPWPPGGSDEPGLVAAYDLATLPRAILPTLQPHRTGQILWQHAACAVENQPIASDVVGFLYERNTPPAVDGLAAAIAAAEAPALADRDDLTGFARACASVSAPEHAAGAFRSTGLRRRQWAVR
jgi:hypothetical protein